MIWYSDIQIDLPEHVLLAQRFIAQDRRSIGQIQAPGFPDHRQAHTVFIIRPEQILRQEVGAVFEQVLEDAGVFKRNEAGQRAFLRFLGTLGMEQEEKL